MSLLRRHFLSLLASTSTLAMSAANDQLPTAAMAHVAWSRQAAIHQVNVRQFTAQGTMTAAQAELPRQAHMGVDILCTDAELYGDHYLPLAVLTFTLPGMPLIYDGQEARLTRRLALFEKNPIAWKTRELQPFYAELLALKHAHPALANGQYGGALTLLKVSNDHLFAFTRSLGADKVTVVVNLSASEQAFRLGATDRSLPAHGWLIESA